MDGYQGEKGLRDWEIRIDTRTVLVPCIKYVTKENRLLRHREPCSVLCGDLNGKEIQKRGYMYS